ncbi:hypothetical protein Hanom_Chr09g00770481 [Helianthus anomalus]
MDTEGVGGLPVWVWLAGAPIGAGSPPEKAPERERRPGVFGSGFMSREGKEGQSSVCVCVSDVQTDRRKGVFMVGCVDIV